MASKELKHMSRSELIEIIYRLKKSEENLIAENEELKARLKAREIKLEKAGSLSEAALALSGIFEAADKAVEIYKDELHRRYSESCREENNTELTDSTDDNSDGNKE